MKLSVYRQGEAFTTMEEAEAIRDTSTLDDIDMIYLAAQLDKPALIGLNGRYAIVKKFAEGDEAHSFDALYDNNNCLTISDLKRQRQDNPQDPDHIPDHLYRVTLNVPAAAVLSVIVRVRATDRPELLSKLRHLHKTDRDFLQEFYKALQKALENQLDYGHAEYVYDTIEEEKEPPKPDTPDWAFEDPS